jgi:hypothetical protein
MNQRGRLRASALFYAVTVALVIAMVTGSSVLLAHYRMVEVERWLALQRAASNARSGITWALTQQPGPKRRDPLFAGDTSTVEWSRMPYGLFDLITVRDSEGNRTVSRSAYAAILERKGPVLSLPKGSGPLHLCGDARIHGDAIVHQADLRRGYIDGRPYTGEQLIDGTVSASERPNPGLEAAWRSRVQAACERGLLEGQVIVDAETLAQRSDEVFPPTMPVLIWTARHLSARSFQGPLIIRSEDTLVIDPDAELDMVMLQAPYIDIRSKAGITVQCFATRGIHVATAVHLAHPSLLCVMPGRGDEGHVGITLDSNAVVLGGVLAIRSTTTTGAAPQIAIGPNALVLGTVHCEGGVELRGEVDGRVTADHLVVRTSSSTYQGYLLDGVLRPDTLGGALSVAPDPRSNWSIVKWNTLADPYAAE